MVDRLEQPVTPVTSIRGEPAPSICAPISTSIAAMSWISGSRAAFSMIVVPLASTAAIMIVSVAPTLGKSSQTSAPCRPCGASAITKPCSMWTFAPIDSSPATCMFSPREPMLSPPGSATSA